jgi:hypothetical protein
MEFYKIDSGIISISGKPGGSAGYIYVNTENKYKQNEIDDGNFSIEAVGGFGQ